MSRMCLMLRASYAFHTCLEITMKRLSRRKPQSGGTRSRPRDKKRSECSRRSTKKTTVGDASQRRNSKIRDLPPNENIRKRSDEVYGDTEIPERKPGT
jgi:hypothetical protein